MEVTEIVDVGVLERCRPFSAHLNVIAFQGRGKGYGSFVIRNLLWGFRLSLTILETFGMSIHSSYTESIDRAV